MMQSLMICQWQISDHCHRLCEKFAYVSHRVNSIAHYRSYYLGRRWDALLMHLKCCYPVGEKIRCEHVRAHTFNGIKEDSPELPLIQRSMKHCVPPSRNSFQSKNLNPVWHFHCPRHSLVLSYHYANCYDSWLAMMTIELFHRHCLRYYCFHLCYRYYWSCCCWYLICGERVFQAPIRVYINF